MVTKASQLIPIVREMLTQEPNALNVTMAEEASRRLGWAVDRKDISKTRNLIGLGMFQQIEAELVKQSTLALHSFSRH